MTGSYLNVVCFKQAFDDDFLFYKLFYVHAAAPYATATTSTAGKILAIFWPIMTFVALGFEHSVANMFLIPHGMLNGATVGLDVINVWMCF